jgi:hypothetical protein
MAVILAKPLDFANAADGNSATWEAGRRRRFVVSLIAISLQEPRRDNQQADQTIRVVVCRNTGGGHFMLRRSNIIRAIAGV